MLFIFNFTELATFVCLLTNPCLPKQEMVQLYCRNGNGQSLWSLILLLKITVSVGYFRLVTPDPTMWSKVGRPHGAALLHSHHKSYRGFL